MSTTLNAGRIAKGGSRTRALAEFLAAFVARHRERRADRRNRKELHELSDHILRDIGVSRANIPWLVDELRRSGKGRPDRQWMI